MIEWLLMAAVAYGVYHLMTRPKPIEDGARWLIVDASDSLPRALLAVFALLTGTLFIFMFLTQGARQPGGLNKDAMIFFVMLVGGYLFLLWHEGRKLIEFSAAGAGEVRIDTWPLKSGHVAELTYTRRLRGGALPVGNVDAELVHYEHQEYRGTDGKRRRRRRRVGSVRLRDGEASFEGGVLEARWRLDVPLPSGDPVVGLIRGVGRLFSRYQERSRGEEWVLEVRMPLRSGVKLDSHFKMEIDFVDIPKAA